MSPETLEAIETVGFPIVAAVGVALFVASILWWILRTFERMYQDHRIDMKEVAKEGAIALSVVTNSFNGEMKNRDARFDVTQKETRRYNTKMLDRVEAIEVSQKETLGMFRRLTRWLP